MHKSSLQEKKQALCRRRSLRIFQEKTAKKFGFRQKCLQSPDAISGIWKNFCEKAPNAALYDFASRGNTLENKDTGGWLCPEK